MANYDYLLTQSELRLGKSPRKSEKNPGNIWLVLLQSYFSDSHYQTDRWDSAHRKTSACNKNTHYHGATP